MAFSNAQKQARHRAGRTITPEQQDTDEVDRIAADRNGAVRQLPTAVAQHAGWWSRVRVSHLPRNTPGAVKDPVLRDILAVGYVPDRSFDPGGGRAASAEHRDGVGRRNSVNAGPCAIANRWQGQQQG